MVYCMFKSLGHASTSELISFFSASEYECDIGSVWEHCSLTKTFYIHRLCQSDVKS